MSECGWQGSQRSSETDIGSEDSDHEGKTCKVEDLRWVHVDAQNEVIVDAETEEPVHRCFEREEQDSGKREETQPRIIDLNPLLKVLHGI